MPYGFYLTSLWALLELGGMVASESSHLHKNTQLAFIPINFKLCGKKWSFSCGATRLHPFISSVSRPCDWFPTCYLCDAPQVSVFFCCLISTCPHIYALCCNAVVKYHPCNPFCSLIHCVFHELWPRRVPIRAIPIKSDMKTNSEPLRLLAEQPFVPSNRKRLHAPVALGYLNNSLRCVDTTVPVSCACATFLSVCTAEIRKWITEERYLGGAGEAELRGATWGQLCVQQSQFLINRHVECDDWIRVDGMW